MNLEDLLQRYFATIELEELNVDALAAGTEKILVDFGLERDRGKRFALWCLLYLLGASPDLEIAFAEERDRDAARNFMDMLAVEDG